MTTQNELKEELCSCLLPFLEQHPKGGYAACVEAAAACMGAAAVVIGATREDYRPEIVDMVTQNLLKHANQRGEDIRNGTFDDERNAARN